MLNYCQIVQFVSTFMPNVLTVAIYLNVAMETGAPIISILCVIMSEQGGETEMLCIVLYCD